jgi:hypothetical protein
MVLEMDAVEHTQYEMVLTMEEDWNSYQNYFPNPWERGLYRIRALLARQKVFRRTIQLGLYTFSHRPILSLLLERIKLTYELWHRVVVSARQAT